MLCRADRRGLLLPVRTGRSGPEREQFPARLVAVLAVLRHGRLRQRRVGVVRGGAPARRAAHPVLRRLLLPLLRAARHRRTAGARQAPGDQGGLGLPRARLLADRRLAAHAVLESGTRAHRTHGGRGREHRARRAGARLPTARHRAGQHGARAALPALIGQPVGGEHRDRGARPDRAVRRAVHLPAAARALPLGATPGRGLVRRVTAARVRALGRPQGSCGPAPPAGRRAAGRAPARRRPAARPPCR